MDRQDQVSQITKTKKTNLRASIHTAVIIVTAFLLIVLNYLLVLQPYNVDGHSMSPTLSDDDRLFVFKTSKVVHSILGMDYIPQRGDIIVFRHTASGENKKFVKRVIGLPNERLIIKNNKITIFNEENPEGFIYKLDLDLKDFPDNEEIYDRIIHEGEVFVLGDNRLPGQSADSRRSLGNIPVDDIEGRVIMKWLPLNDFQLF